MAVMPTDQTAPAELELVREFVNTLDVEDGHRFARLARGRAGLARGPWPRGRGAGRSPRPTASRLIDVREALRDLLLANNLGSPPPPEALAVLNEQSAEAAVVLRFGADGAALVTQLRQASIRRSRACSRSSTDR